MRPVNLCGNDTCTWIVQNGTWTVQSTRCPAGCGCYDSTNPDTSYIDPAGNRVVAPSDFHNSAKIMLSDSRLSGRKSSDGVTDLLTQTLPSTSPSNGQTFETPCMS